MPNFEKSTSKGTDCNAQVSSTGILEHGDDVSSIRAAWLGTVEYKQSVNLQKKIAERAIQGESDHRLLLLEHPNVFTLGRRGDPNHVLQKLGTNRSLEVPVITSDRGGEVTYHGPGQLVGYPIVNLRLLGLGPVKYVCVLEESIIQTLDRFDVHSHRVPGKTGVWVGGNPNVKVRDRGLPKGHKIAAIGVRISKGLTSHGFALNVNTDLRYFDRIVPCGMPGLPVTSLKQVTGVKVQVETIAHIIAKDLAANLGVRLDWSKSTV